MYTEEDILSLLEGRNIWFHVDRHEAVFDMDALSSVKLAYPDAEAKNLFLRDDRKENYYLFVVMGDRKSVV